MVLVPDDEPVAVFCWRGCLTGVAAAGLVIGAAGAVGVISLLALTVGLLVVLVAGVFGLGVGVELDAALSRLLCLACSCSFFFRSWSWRCRREPSRANSVAIDTPCLPPSEGFNLQLRACLKVSSSNLLLPLEFTIRTLVTLPLSSVSTATSTLPSMPRRLANSG